MRDERLAQLLGAIQDDVTVIRKRLDKKESKAGRQGRKMTKEDYEKLMGAVQFVRTRLVENGWLKAPGGPDHGEELDPTVVEYVRSVVDAAAEQSGAKKKEVMYAWLYGMVGAAVKAKGRGHEEEAEPTDEESRAFSRGYDRAAEKVLNCEV